MVDVPVPRPARQPRRCRGGRASWCCSSLGGGMVGADRITAAADDNLYADEVILARNTRYQRIVLTRVEGRPPAVPELAPAVQLARRVPLSRGAGASRAGGAARRAARAGARRRRRPGGARDPEVPGSRERHAGRSRPRDDAPVLDAPRAARAERRPALSPRGARHQRRRLPVARSRQPSRSTSCVVDFPDPTNFSLGKLYTTAFYRLLAQAPQPRRDCAVVQSTSPLFARQSYWCIVETLKQAGLARAGPITSTCRRSASGASCWRAPAPTSRRRACRTACASSRRAICRRCSSFPTTCCRSTPSRTASTTRCWCATTSTSGATSPGESRCYPRSRIWRRAFPIASISSVVRVPIPAGAGDSDSNRRRGEGELDRGMTTTVL